MNQAMFLQLIQRMHSPVLDTWMVIITTLGNDGAYYILLPIFYWWLPSGMGLRLIGWVSASLYGAETLKVWFHTTRPIGTPGIRSINTESAPGYSFPSGHTQGATTFWGYLAHLTRRKWMAYTGIIVVCAVAFSRVYLGVHWPIDIAGGAIAGLIFIAVAVFTGHRMHQFPPYMIKLGMLGVTGVAWFASYNDIQRQLVLFWIPVFMGHFVRERWIRVRLSDGKWTRLAAAIIGGSILFTLESMGQQLGTVIRPIYDHLFAPFAAGVWATIGAPLVFKLCGLAEIRGGDGDSGKTL